ncbi:MAG TPA: hypothetical protein VMW02_00810 [Thermoplasmata archaeon]|nr:hypothetical protein [Thermoplasmata archaeon]
MANHLERLSANILTGGTIDHLSTAGNELLKAVNKTMEDMSLPEETKKHLLAAERETLLAIKGFLDATIKEIDRIEKGEKKPAKRGLKKIKIE